MTVVILAQECDASVDEVIGQLTDREVSVFRADTSWFPQRLTIQARLEGEARVVVVGDRVFPFLIHADSAAARIDWRTDYRVLRYELAELPVSVENGVRCYMAAFGLVYAAFDFAIDATGQWFFLEANTAGQYGFLETNTGAAISDALADLLAGGAGD